MPRVCTIFQGSKRLQTILTTYGVKYACDILTQLRDLDLYSHTILADEMISATEFDQYCDTDQGMSLPNVTASTSWSG